MEALQFKLPDELATAVTNLAKDALKTAVTEVRNNQQTPGYLKAKEASEYLGVSRTTFNAWVKKHGVKTVEIDGVRRYSRASLDEFMKNHEH